MKHQIINVDLRTDLEVTVISAERGDRIRPDRIYVQLGNGAILTARVFNCTHVR